MNSSENRRNEPMPVSTSIDPSAQNRISLYLEDMSTGFVSDFNNIIDSSTPNETLRSSLLEIYTSLGQSITARGELNRSINEKYSDDPRHAQKLTKINDMYIEIDNTYYFIYEIILSVFESKYETKIDFIKNLYSVIKKEYEKYKSSCLPSKGNNKDSSFQAKETLKYNIKYTSIFRTKECRIKDTLRNCIHVLERKYTYTRSHDDTQFAQQSQGSNGSTESQNPNSSDSPIGSVPTTSLDEDHVDKSHEIPAVNNLYNLLEGYKNDTSSIEDIKNYLKDNTTNSLSDLFDKELGNLENTSTSSGGRVNGFTGKNRNGRYRRRITRRKNAINRKHDKIKNKISKRTRRYRKHKRFV